MIAADYDAFVAEFKRLSAALERFKQAPADLERRADAYFATLKGYTLAEVSAKADAWLSKETKFPAPAEWAGVIPARPALDLQVLTDAESRDYRDAERCGYERAPCECPRCVHAGVDEKPQRFVPEVGVQMRDGNRVVTAGYWAHGTELARWYAARANFWNRCFELGLVTIQERKTVEKRPFAERLEQLFARR
jgi:hypothetical protein